MSTRKPQHRLERLQDRLTTEIKRQVADLAVQLKGPGGRPPFAVALTEDEQIEQYFAMTPEKWQAMVHSQGLKQTLAYSEAMLRLLARRFGPLNPTAPILPDALLNGQTAEQLPQGQPNQPPLPPPDQGRIDARAHEIVQSVLNSIGAPHA